MAFRVLLLVLLLAVPVWGQMPLVDLSQIAGGARPLALGMAQTAGSKDLSSIFFNPAGLGNLKTMRYAGMSGTILQELSYITGMAAWPGRFGVLGLGYIGTQLPDIPITSRGGAGGNTIITQEATATYSISEIRLSYGTALSRFLAANWAGNFRVGADAHVTSEQVPGRLGRTRLDMAYGFQHVIARSFTWGLVWRPTGLTGGIRIFVPEDLFELEVFADAVTSAGLPTLLRSGVEWRPTPEMALRFGFNQQWRSGGVENGLTAGLGLDFAGLLLDYAYRPIGSIQDNAVHFFSLGFELGKILPRQNPVKTVVPAEIVSIPDLVLFSDMSSKFWANAPVQYMAALGILHGYSDGTFKPEGFVSKESLEEALKNALGVPMSLSFHPRSAYSLLRREAVRAVVEAVGLRPPKKFTKPFVDVRTDDPIAGFVAVAKEEGYLEYISGEPFEGDRPITRAEIAEILSKVPIVKVRIKQFLTGETPAPPATSEEEEL